MEELVPINAVAEYLTVSPKTVYHWVHVGFIPHYKFPKGIRFRFSEVENWIKKRKQVGRRAYALEMEL